ncbi:hypothetical protein Tco_1035811 [Tanacetum coccineum]
MLLLLTQNKLFNLDGDVIVHLGVALRMFTRGIVLKSRVEDVQLGVESYQRKLNLTRPQRTCPGMSAKKLYTPNYDRQGVIYKDKKKRKRLMRVDELHKFSDGTLQSVHKTLLHRLKNFRLGYNHNSDMPRREWIEKDQKCTGYVLRKIDDQLLRKIIMRSLEVLVGGRNTETDRQLL